MSEKVSEKFQKHLGTVMAVALIVSMYLVAGQAAVYVNSANVVNELQKENKVCVVIDAGHGGTDPGKVGVNNLLEKDINLQIAYILKGFLEAADVKVILTREGDEGLYQEGDSNKKVQDMKNRLSLIDGSGAELVVSIHQNSYTEEYVKGAQVFYYKSSVQGKKLADIIQQQMIAGLDSSNRRVAKGNDSYYLLKKTKTPIVIVECGFFNAI